MNHDFSGGSRGGDQHEMGNRAEDPTSPSGGSSNGPAEKRKSKKSSRQPGIAIHPEALPNYMGNITDVDNLVKFVNNEIGGKKLKKISKPSSGSSPYSSASAVATTTTDNSNSKSRTPTTTATTASASPASKTPKKTKERSGKTKQLQTTGVGESVEDPLTPASETTQLLSSASLASSYSSVGEHVAREQAPDSSEVTRAGSPDAKDLLAKEMGNSGSSTCDRPGGDGDVMIPRDNSEQPAKRDRVVVVVQEEPVKNDTVPEVSVTIPVKPVFDSKSESTKNHKNNTLSTSSYPKSAPAGKKDPGGESKDSKDKGKAKSAGGGGKDGVKSESVPAGTDNNANKKSKSRPPKSDEVKPAAPVSEKSSPEAKKEAKVDSGKDAAKSKPSKSPPATSATAPKTPSNFELAIDGSNFIFTDVGILPNVKEPEQEFILVSKKKKRSPVQSTPQGQGGNAQSFSQHYHHHHHSKDFQQPFSSQSSFAPYHHHHNYNRGGLRETSVRHHPPQKTRSCTPPPSFPTATATVMSSAGSESAAKTRDLSPSAFPVLKTTTGRASAKVSPLGTEARRRSLEDVTFDTGQLLPFDKDSDRESTKSLPADKGVGGGSRGGGGGGGGGVGGGSYPVSYATMASSATSSTTTTPKTPRQSVDSSKAESVSSSMEDTSTTAAAANLEEFPAAPTASMKWKGSPQERRHSIGSAPEELSKLAGGGVGGGGVGGGGGGLQRSGSQEVLPRDADALDKGGAAAMAVPTAMGLMTQSDSAGSFAGSDADSARGSEAGSEVTGEVFASSPSSHLVGTAAEDRKTAAAEEAETKAAVAAVSAGRTSTIPAGSVPAPPSQTMATAIGGGSGGQLAVSVPSTASVAVAAAAVKPKGTPSSSGSRSQPAAAVAISKKAEPGSKSNPLVVKPVNNGHKLKNCVEFYGISGEHGRCPMDVSFGGEPLFNFGKEEGGGALASVASGGDDDGKSTAPTPHPPPKDKVSGSVASRPPAGHPSSAVPPPPSSSSSDIAPSSKPAKGPHIAGLNGLVSPQRSDSARSALQPSSTSATVPTALQSSSCEPPACGQTVVVSQAGGTEGPFDQQQQQQQALRATGGSVAPTVTSPPAPSQPCGLPTEARVAGGVPLSAPGGGPMSVPEGGILVMVGSRVPGQEPQCKVFLNREAATPPSPSHIEAANHLLKGRRFFFGCVFFLLDLDLVTLADPTIVV